jgi:hypothetical protein
MPVFRFGVRAQPTANNPKYATWQPADFIAFMADTMASNPMSPPRPDESFIGQNGFPCGRPRTDLIRT